MNKNAHLLALRITLIISGTLLALSSWVIHEANTKFNENLENMVASVVVTASSSEVMLSWSSLPYFTTWALQGGWMVSVASLWSIWTITPTSVITGTWGIMLSNTDYENIFLPLLGFIKTEKFQVIKYMAFWFWIFLFFLYLIAYVIARNIMKPIEEAKKHALEYSRYIAHEIRTPLLIISSDIELMMHESKDTKIFERTIGELQSLSTIVDGLLFLALSENTLEKEYLNLESILEDVWENLKKQYKTDIVLHKNQKKVSTVYGNPMLTKTLIHNLMENAIKYNTGKDIFVVFEKNSLQITNPAQAPKEERKRDMFAPFLWKSDIGHGLGLSLVKRIIDVHGWYIEWLYTKATGMTFEIVFQKR